METILGPAEERLRACILERYRSVRAFAMALGVPCSTVSNVLRRGVQSVNLSTATTLCDALGLDIAAFVHGEMAPAVGGQSGVWERELLADCRAMDDHGRELVGLVAQKERERCAGQRVEFPRSQAGSEGWRQYVGAPIACRGGGVTSATEQDARQMDKIYRNLLEGRGDDTR